MKETTRNDVVVLLGILLFLATITLGMAQSARFFRIAGPVEATITALSADGSVTWTNAVTNTTFTVQAADSLLNPVHWVDYVQVPVSNPVTTHRLLDPNPPTNMVLIPAGSFTMGNCMDSSEGNSDELPLHTNYVSAFYMDRFLVTKALWDEVRHWATNYGYTILYGAGYTYKGPNHPVDFIEWYEAVKWCNARSEKEGRTPAYYTDSGQTAVYRSGRSDVLNGWVKWNAGYRLPTEAEWEKAARGGASGRRFPWSDADTITHSRANYRDSLVYPYDLSHTYGYNPTFKVGLIPYSSPVGYFLANGYGLYDMAGDNEEWCWDRYGLYSSDPQSDPRSPDSGETRVGRGANWGDLAFSCRVGHRYSYYPGHGSDGGIGFRTVLPSPPH